LHKLDGYNKPVLIAAALILAQAANTVVYTGESILAMQWHPDGKRLYWLTEKSLNEWPSKKRWDLPKTPTQLPVLGAVHMDANQSGSKLLISARYLGAYFLFDTRTSKMTAVRNEYHNVWWIGDKVARIAPTVRKEAWFKPDFLEYDGRRRELPGEWLFGAADQSVLLAKQGHMSPIALFRLDHRTLKLSRFRIHREKFYAEYIEQDSLAWNERLQIAAIGLTADTGATSAAPLLSLQGRTHDFGGEFLFTEGNPAWIGNRVLLSTREARQQIGEKVNHGADIYSIRLYDPRTRKFHVIDSVDNHWIWRHDTEPSPNPPRSEQPTLGLAVATRNGRLLAHVKSHLGTSQIIVRSIP
jgi:hypothetical protein